MVGNKTLLATTGSGLARAARDDAGRWTVTSLLKNDEVHCVAADPLDSRVVYAGTAGNGVLRSEDGGQTWRTAGLTGQIVKSLAVSPLQPGILYAGVKPAGMLVSRDSGATWAALDGFQRIRGRRWWRSPAEPPDWRAYVQAIALSPVDPNVIMAGIEFGAVVRSADGGKTWSNHRKGAIRDCHGLIFHATDGNWVYEAGASLVGTAVSRNAGISWEQPGDGLHHRYGWSCAADPRQPEVWYLSAGPIGWSGVPQAHRDGQANAAIYRKSGGAPWERLGGGLPQPLTHMAYGLLTDRDAPGHVYAGLSHGEVWHTADYGDSWHKLPCNLGRIRQMVLL